MKRFLIVGATVLMLAGALNAVPVLADQPAPHGRRAEPAHARRPPRPLHRHRGRHGRPGRRRRSAVPGASSRRSSPRSPPRTSMKWESLEPTRGTYNWGPADELIDFARSNNQQVRGHVLVWHNQLPGWLTRASPTARSARTSCATSCATTSPPWSSTSRARSGSGTWSTRRSATRGTARRRSTYKGFWAQHLGPGYIADAFRWARAADPKALLFYNDYNIEAFGDRRPVATRRSSSTTWPSSCARAACRSTASAARATSAPSTATTTPSRSPTALEALRRPRAGHRVHRGRRAQPDDRRACRRATPTRSTRACRRRRPTTACCCRPAWPTGTACRSRCGASPTSTPGCPAGSPTRRRAWPPCTTRTTSPSGRTTSMKADLIFTGPPYVLPRIPQKPRR